MDVKSSGRGLPIAASAIPAIPLGLHPSSPTRRSPFPTKFNPGSPSYSSSNSPFRVLTPCRIPFPIPHSPTRLISIVLPSPCRLQPPGLPITCRPHPVTSEFHPSHSQICLPNFITYDRPSSYAEFGRASTANAIPIACTRWQSTPVVRPTPWLWSTPRRTRPSPLHRERTRLTTSG